MNSSKQSHWKCLHWLRCCLPPVPLSRPNSPVDTVVLDGSSSARNLNSATDVATDEAGQTEIGLESMIKDFSILEVSQVAGESDFSFSCSEVPSTLQEPPLESFISRESVEIGTEESADCSLSLYDMLRTQALTGPLGASIRPRKPAAPSGKRDGRGRKYNPGASRVLADLIRPTQA